MDNKILDEIVAWKEDVLKRGYRALSSAGIKVKPPDLVPPSLREFIAQKLGRPASFGRPQPLSAIHGYLHAELEVSVEHRWRARKVLTDALGPDFVVRYYMHPKSVPQNVVYVFPVGHAWPDAVFTKSNVQSSRSGGLTSCNGNNGLLEEIKRQVNSIPTEEIQKRLAQSGDPVWRAREKEKREAARRQEARERAREKRQRETLARLLFEEYLASLQRVSSTHERLAQEAD